MRASSVIAVLAAALTVPACDGPGPDATLEPLEGIAELRQAFEEDAGRPRLVLLLSPT